MWYVKSGGGFPPSRRIYINTEFSVISVNRKLFVRQLSGSYNKKIVEMWYVKSGGGFPLSRIKTQKSKAKIFSNIKI